MHIDGEKTIELDGFVMDNGETIISDSKSIGDWEKTKIHIEPNMLRFLIMENKSEIEEICSITIIE